MHFIRFLFKQPNIQKLMKLSPPPPAAACRGLTASAAANSLQSRAAPHSLAVCTGRAGFAKRSAPSLRKNAVPGLQDFKSCDSFQRSQPDRRKTFQRS